MSQDDPTTRRHAHTCEKCGHTWIHDPDACVGDEATEESCAAAHYCPKCGAEQRWVDVAKSDPAALAEACAAPGGDPRMGAGGRGPVTWTNVPATGATLGTGIADVTAWDAALRAQYAGDAVFLWRVPSDGSGVVTLTNTLDQLQSVTHSGDPIMGAAGAAATWDYLLCGGDCPEEGPIVAGVPSDQIPIFDASLREQYAGQAGAPPGVLLWRQPSGTWRAGQGWPRDAVRVTDTRCHYPRRGPRMGAAGEGGGAQGAPDAGALGPLGGLLGALLPQAERGAQGIIQGAGKEAGQAAGKAAGESAGAAVQAAVPQVAAAMRRELPGLAASLGQALAPAIAPAAQAAGREAGAAAGKAAAETARAEVERQKDEIRAEVKDAAKVGGLVLGGLALGGGALYLIFSGKKKGD